MAYHFVAIVNDYSQGCRIGWHYFSEERLDKKIIKGFMDEVERECGSVQLGIHKFSTDSTTWKSVVEKDSFFKDVAATTNKEYFIQQIKQDKILGAQDVAKLILSILPTTHLKLQKLLYYAYAEFLKQTNRKLFQEPIVAFKFGPVVEEVYQKYRDFGSLEIGSDEDKVFQMSSIAITPSFMKMIASEQGLTAAKCTLDVIGKYKDMSAVNLVNKTHAIGGPWHRSYVPGANKVITDDVILEYHAVVL